MVRLENCLTNVAKTLLAIVVNIDFLVVNKVIKDLWTGCLLDDSSCEFRIVKDSISQISHTLIRIFARLRAHY
ncbi:hypothetical protein C492_11800 [Natronococcus jeotgali DSM 18795]|uniref:Uncharacterized protein n=1 Tax=Natronococcus jeotgali DSM 18795 TaxID=1227498 RepID=L9XA60_9EURY|nr:hypothetical protein C492_11800 [Natronococcus jeotgali DSM 18795]